MAWTDFFRIFKYSSEPPKFRIWAVYEGSTWGKVVCPGKPKVIMSHYLCGPFPTEEHAEEFCDLKNDYTGGAKRYYYQKKLDAEKAKAELENLEVSGKKYRSIDDG